LGIDPRRTNHVISLKRVVGVGAALTLTAGSLALYSSAASAAPVVVSVHAGSYVDLSGFVPDGYIAIGDDGANNPCLKIPLSTVPGPAPSAWDPSKGASLFLVGGAPFTTNIGALTFAPVPSCTPNTVDTDYSVTSSGKAGTAKISYKTASTTRGGILAHTVSSFTINHADCSGGPTDTTCVTVTPGPGSTVAMTRAAGVTTVSVTSDTTFKAKVDKTQPCTVVTKVVDPDGAAGPLGNDPSASYADCALLDQTSKGQLAVSVSGQSGATVTLNTLRSATTAALWNQEKGACKVMKPGAPYPGGTLSTVNRVVLQCKGAFDDAIPLSVITRGIAASPGAVVVGSGGTSDPDGYFSPTTNQLASVLVP